MVANDAVLDRVGTAADRQSDKERSERLTHFAKCCSVFRVLSLYRTRYQICNSVIYKCQALSPSSLRPGLAKTILLTSL